MNACSGLKRLKRDEVCAWAMASSFEFALEKSQAAEYPSCAEAVVARRSVAAPSR
jgi:hypothetical protein